MEHYREALGVDPDHAGSIAGLSATLIQAKRYEDARSMLEELLRVSPDEAGAHLNLGLIAHKTGDLDGRSKALNTFMELDPASPHRAKLLELLTGGTVDEEGGAPTGL